MAEETWHAARLIPTSGIGGADEQERRATSALLAVIPTVKDFARSLLQPLSAPAGNYETFIEVPFDLNGHRLYPDGLIRIKRGAKSWVVLVEVKTGDNVLEAQQLENYLDIARGQSFDAVLTISNEIPSHSGSHPTLVDKRKTKKVPLHHLSWTEVLTEAVMQKTHRGISDPEQAWILGELIRYLEHPKSGALQFSDMGSSWTDVRDAIHTGTFRSKDKGATEVANRWEQLMRHASLKLGQRLGVEVQPVLSRKDLSDPSLRVSALVSQMAEQSALSGAIRIPDAVAPINVVADLRASRLTCFVDVEAPRDGRPQTRVNWLIRQLKDAPESLRIDCFAARARGASTSELLAKVRATPAVLVADSKTEIRSFRLALSMPMGVKRGSGRGGFVTSVLDLVDTFYGDVLQTVKPWAAHPPKLRSTEVEADAPKPAALASVSLSSQDGPSDNSGVISSDKEPDVETNDVEDFGTPDGLV